MRRAIKRPITRPTRIKDSSLINPKVVLLREVIVKLTPMIAGKGLRVTQIGARAYAQADKNGKPVLVNIPHIPDSADDVFLMAIQGFIDHEVAHILFTDFSPAMTALKIERGRALCLVSKQPEKAAQKQFHNYHNIVEDPFIEKMMAQRFKGSAYNLERLHEMFLARVTLPAIERAASPAEKFSYIIVPLTRAWCDQPIFQRFMDDNKLWAHPLVAAFVKAMPAADIARMPLLKSTTDTLSIAELYYKILHPAPPPPPPPPKPEPKPEDEKEEDESSSDESKSAEKSDEKEDGEGSNEDKPEDDEDKGAGGEKDDESDDDTSETEGDPAKAKAEEGNEEDDDAEESAGPAEEEDPTSDGDDEPAGTDGDEKADDAKPEPAGDDDSEDGAGGDDEDEGDEDDGDPKAGSGSADADDDADDAEGDGNSDSEPGDSSDAAGDAGEDDDEAEAPAGGEEDDDDEVGEPEKEEATAHGQGFSPFSDVELPDLEDQDLSSAIAEIITDAATRECRVADYRIYTRELDKIEVVADWDDLPVDAVKKMEDDTQHMVAPMQKDIERMMAARSQSVRVPGFRSGRLHAGSLHRLTTNDDRVFRRKQEHKSKETAVTLLIDNSGSMSGQKVEIAMKAGMALSQTLERLDIKHEVLGFTTLQYQKWNSDKTALGREIAREEDRIGKSFSRTEPLHIPIYKTFDERLTPLVKRRFAMPLNGRVRLIQNIDGESVRIAASRLSLRREVRKVLIVLSDGSPAAQSDFPHEICADLHRAVADVARMKIDLVGIGIMDDSVSHYYPKFTVLRDLASLPGAVLTELKSILTS